MIQWMRYILTNCLSSNKLIWHPASVTSRCRVLPAADIPRARTLKQKKLCRIFISLLSSIYYSFYYYYFASRHLSKLPAAV